MAASPQIIIDIAGESSGTPGVSRTFSYSKINGVSPLVTLRIANTVGVNQYYWEIVSKPVGSPAVFDDPSLPTPSFFAASGFAGTYLIRVTINNGSSSGTNGLAFRTPSAQLRKLSHQETLEFGGKGWTTAVNDIIDALDAGILASLTLISYYYTDEAARLAATGFVGEDVGKWARQMDDNSIWSLDNHSPITWTAIVPGRTVSGPASSVAGNISVFDDASGRLIADSGVSLSDLAPSDSKFWLSDADASLPNSVDLSALGSSGLLFVTQAGGEAVPSIAAAGTDFQSPLDFTTGSVINTGDVITLSGDSASPGNNFFYGANRAGTKGFYTRDKSKYRSVGPAGSDVDFNSVGAAILYALSQGAGGYGGTPDPTDQWDIEVFPGIYPEAPMVVPMGVNIHSRDARVDTAFVVATDPTDDLFTLAGGFVSGINASGPLNSGKALFRVGASAVGTLNVIDSVHVSNCDKAVYVTDGCSCIVMDMSAIIVSASSFVDTLIEASGAGSYIGISGLLVSSSQVLADAELANPINTVVSCHDGAEIYLSAGTVRTAWYAAPGCSAKVIHCYDNSTVIVSGAEFALSGDVLCVGAGSKIVTQGANFRSNHLNILTLDATGRVYVSHSVDTEATDSVVGSAITGVIQVRDEDLTRILGAAKYRYLSAITDGLDVDVDIGRFFAELSSAGITGGGIVTALTGLDVRVTDVQGWARRPDSPKFDAYSVDGPPASPGYTDLTLDASKTNYVYYDSANDVVTFNSSSAPAYKENLILATVVTGATGIRYLHQTRNLVDRPVERLRDRLLQTHNKVAIVSGLLVVPGTSATTQLSVGNGVYYLGLDSITCTLASNTDVTFSAFYGVDGATEVTGQTTIDSANYDPLTGSLAAMGAGTFKSDSLVVTSDGKLSLIYGTNTYATELLAIDSPFEVIPTILGYSACPIARIIIEEGVGIVAIVDARPGGSGSVGASGGGVVNHDDTTGAAASTVHTAFLLLDGTRAMSGGLDMGSQSISNVNLVDGVDVSTHKSRHDPGGADALTMASDANVQAVTADGSNTANVGAVNAFAYATHKHVVTTSATAPTSVGTTASAGSGSAVAFANHSHNHADIAGSITAGVYHGVATSTLHGFMSPAHFTKLDTQAVTYTSGAVVVAGNFPSFSGTTGKLIVDSGYKAADFALAGHNHSSLYEPILTKNNLTVTGSLTVSGGSGAVIGASPTVIGINTASTSVSGALSSTDWNTFNNKVTYLSSSIARKFLVWGSTDGKTLAVDSTVLASVTSYTGAGVASTLTLGSAGNSAGQVTLEGVTAGRVTLQSAASVGTPYTITLPSTVGTSNYVLQGTVSGAVVSLGWVALPTPNPGDVVGISTTVVDGHVVVYHGVDGKAIKTSGVAFSDVMLLSAAQAVSGAKTFDAGTLLVKGASTGTVTLAYGSTVSNATQTFQVSNGTVYCTSGIDVAVVDGGTGKSSWTVGPLYASSSGVLTSETYLNVARGGTGVGTHTNGSVLLGAGAGAITSIATLDFARGGTGATSFTAGIVTYVSGTALTTVASLGISQGGTGATSLANGVIVKEGTALSSVPQLSVARGGTGVGTHAAGEILLGNGTGNILSTAILAVANGGTGKSSWTVGAVFASAAGVLASETYLSVTRGGTGVGTHTSGNILLGNGTGSITSTAILAISKGGTAKSSWTAGAVYASGGALASETYLSVTRGGTGVGTHTAGNILLGAGIGNIASTEFLDTTKGGTGVTSFTAGVVVYVSGTALTTVSSLSISQGGTGSTSIASGVVTSNGTVLSSVTRLGLSQGGTNATAIAAGVVTSSGTALSSVTSLGLSQGGTGATSIAAGVVVSSGSALSSVNELNVARGGTGVTTLAAGHLIFGNGTSGVTTAASLVASKGGTGITAYVSGDLIYASGAAALARLPAPAAAHRFLRGGATAGAVPFYSQVEVAGLYATGTVGNILVVGASNTVTSVTNNLHVHNSSFNTFVGNSSLTGTYVGTYNTAMGYNTLTALTTNSASYNTAYGFSSLLTLSLGQRNTAIGSNSGRNITSGTDNTAVGHNALGVTSGTVVCSGIGNTAIGSGCLSAATLAADNVAVGYSVLGSLTTGAYNIGLGTLALTGITTVSHSIGIGYQAVGRATTSYNIGIGYLACMGVIGGAENIGIGRSALGYALGTFSTSQRNIAIGSHVMSKATDASYNVGIGNVALDGLTMGAHNVGIGSEALGLITTQNFCVGIGYRAAKNATVDDVIGIGTNACYGVLNGVENIGIGKSALGNSSVASTGNHNLAIGTSTLVSVTSGYSNVVAGNGSARAVTTGYGNVVIGKDAAILLAVGLGNVVVGYGAAAYLTGTSTTTGSDNVIIGYNACSVTNVDLGHSITSGRRNVAIGYRTYIGGADSSCVAIGNGTFVYNNNSIGIGWAANCSGGGIAIGANATSQVTGVALGVGAQNEGGVAVGSASFAGSNAITIGYSSSGLNGVVIGHGASGTNRSSNGIAIGHGTAHDGGINIGCLSHTPTPSVIRIGTSTVHSYFYAGATTTWSFSDKRLKTDIGESELGLDFVLSLQPVSYRWKRKNADGSERPSSRKSFGFIAQDVMSVIDNDNFRLVDDPTINDPEVDESSSHMSLAYQDFMAPMVKAIQEQQDMIEELRAEILSLRGR